MTVASAVSFTGLSTGIDWTSVITKLMAADQAPVTSMQNQQSLLQQKDGVYTSLQGSLQSIQASADTLRRLGGAALNGSAATSSDATVASATAQSGALLGSVSLNVQSLASTASALSTAAVFTGSGNAATAPSFVSAADIRSSPSFDPTASLASQSSLLGTAPGASGSISIGGGSVSWSSADSLNTLLGRINSANLGVTASYDAASGKVSLTGMTQSSAATLSLSESGGPLLASLGLSAGTQNGTDAKAFDPTQTLASQSALMDSPVTAGTFTMNGVTFTVDPATQSLNDILRAISSSSAGVQGLFDSSGGKLALRTTATGAAATITEGASGDSSNFLSAMKLGAATSGTDAKVSVNGGAVQSLSSNTATGLLPGATLTLQGVGTATVTVSPDSNGAAAAVKSLVDAFNGAVNTISTRLNDSPMPPSTSTAQPTTALQGAFIGDPLLQQTQDSLLNMVVGTRVTTGQTRELSQIGITLTSTAPGQPQTISFDQATFTAAFQNDPAGVQALIADPGTGLADKLYKGMDALVNGDNSAYGLQLSGDTTTLDTLTKNISDMQAQLTYKQQQMQTQYANLEATLGAMQAQANQLSGTFSAMAAGTFS